jgi:hypothetical protein
MAHELVKSWAVASDHARTLKIRFQPCQRLIGEAKRVEIVTAQGAVWTAFASRLRQP